MTDWRIIVGVLAAAVVAFAAIAWRLYAEAVAARRERHIRTYVFSGALFDKLRDKHGHLELKDCHLVARALREFFLAHLRSGRRYVGMPSRVVDDLWHEFILDTAEYARFCQVAFGRYFHHTPTSSLGKSQEQDAGLRRTWRYACMEENIHSRKPTRMPLLFAIDEKLNIAKGFHYTLPKPREKSGGSDSGGCGGGGGLSCSGGSGCGGGGCGGGGCGGT